MSHLIKNGTSLLRQGSNIFGVKDTITLTSTAISGFTGPVAIALDTANNKYFVYNWSGGVVRILNLTTNAEIASVTGFGTSYGGIALDVANDRYYVSSGSTVRIMKYSDNTQIASITGFTYAYGIALDIPNNRYFVSNTTSIRVMKYSDNSELFHILNFTNTYKIVADNSNNRLYVCDRGAGKFKIFNLTTFELITTISLTNCCCASIDSLNNKLYLTAFTNHVYMYNLTTLAAMATISVVNGGVLCEFDNTNNNLYVGYYNTTSLYINKLILS